MSKKNKSVIPAVVIGLAATVAGFTVALRSLKNASAIQNFKAKFACSNLASTQTNEDTPNTDSWGEDAPHDIVQAGSDNKKVIYIDPMSGFSLDALPGAKVFNLKADGEPGTLDPFAFAEDRSKGKNQDADETIVFLDSVSGDELNGEELPKGEKKLGKRSAEGYPAAYEAEEVFDYLEQEFGITSPTINPKGDISAAIQAHDNLASLIEEGKDKSVTIEASTQEQEQLDKVLAATKKKKKPAKVTELAWKDFTEFKEKYSSLIQDAFDASKDDKDFVLKVSGKTHGIGARGTAGKTKAGKEFKSFDAKDIAAIHKKVNS